MNTKLKCLLLDDELPSLTYLKLLCEQIPALEVVKVYNAATKLLADLEAPEALDFDLLITDIEMPEVNGLQLAERLQGKAVIFTTAYSDYAADAFDLHAIDYLRKPLKLDRLQQAIAKVKLQRPKKAAPAPKTFVPVNSDKGKLLLYFDQICYIRTADLDSRDKVVYLSDHNEVTLKNISFAQLIALLPTDAFCRVNKKEVIAMRLVSSFSHEEITSTLAGEQGNKTFILGEKFKTDFLQKVAF
ncbi:response regulator transcription factor [Sphingobacterium psychroaquaticum]|uniref:LytR/AlgR family response regulator transcription factor n=1 Tax=Sphingobacterium psychroaquaticum TaxID=561061 RepID=UPI00106D39F8|nr:response regulator [Sphingobacterium psychroaquaticum]QBQ42047.1 response regulator transcription factor [Sphingobacterium psychroaquaticum]